MTHEREHVTPVAGSRRLLPLIPRGRLTRRTVLGGAAVAGGGAWVAGCTDDQPELTGDEGEVATEDRFDVPGPPEQAPDGSVLLFFSAVEARELDALLEVVLPGDPGEPGARDAGVLAFIDYTLGHFPDGRAERGYSRGPFAEVRDGGSAATGSDDGPTVPVSPEDASLYGSQSSLSARETMRMGLVSFARFARRRFGAPFSSLTTAQQEDVVGALFDGSASDFDEPSAQTFATTVRDWIVQGMFADPSYGGNRDMAGWVLTGYPGPQRAYTQPYLLGLVPELPRQTLADLHHFNPGEHQEPGVPGEPVLPVGGSRDGRETEENQGR